MNKFRDVLDAAVTSREVYHARCLIVWRELQAAEPELAAEILALGFDEPTAAQWVCQPDRDGVTPASLVAIGRSAEVLSTIHRTIHGFVG